jgi:hypothetical protein
MARTKQTARKYPSLITPAVDATVALLLSSLAVVLPRIAREWLFTNPLPQQASPLVARPLVSSSLPRLPAKRRPLLEVSRSLTATSLVSLLTC